MAVAKRIKKIALSPGKRYLPKMYPAMVDVTTTITVDTIVTTRLFTKNRAKDAAGRSFRLAPQDSELHQGEAQHDHKEDRGLRRGVAHPVEAEGVLKNIIDQHARQPRRRALDVGGEHVHLREHVVGADRRDDRDEQYGRHQEGKRDM